MDVGGDEPALFADELPLDNLVARLDETLGGSAEVLAHGDHERSGKRNRLNSLVSCEILVVLGMDAAMELEG